MPRILTSLRHVVVALALFFYATPTLFSTELSNGCAYRVCERRARGDGSVSQQATDAGVQRQGLPRILMGWRRGGRLCTWTTGCRPKNQPQMTL